MNLNKAKTVLIVCFLVLNLFLGYQLQQRARGMEQGDNSNAAQWQQLQSQLSERNISLDTALPAEVNRAALLKVLPPELPGEMAQRLSQGVSSQILPNKDSRLEGPAGRAIIGSSGLLRFFPENNGQTIENLTLETAQQLAQQFVKDNHILPPDAFQFSGHQEEEGTFSFVYHQSYLNIKIFASILEINVGNRGVTEVYYYWLQPQGFKGEEQPLLTPVEALSRFLEHYPSLPSETGIRAITYGYFSRPYQAQEWDLPPVWRIELHSGEIFFVNAFSGRLEELEERVDQN